MLLFRLIRTHPPAPQDLANDLWYCIADGEDHVNKKDFAYFIPAKHVKHAWALFDVDKSGDLTFDEVPIWPCAALFHPVSSTIKVGLRAAARFACPPRAE